MSVATRNPFALLNDEIVEASTPAPPSSTPAQPDPKPASKEQKPRSGPASRGGRYYQRGGAAKNVAKDTQDNEAESAPRENRKTEGVERGRGRGGRGGGARGRGGPAGRGRQYDRHSGTLPDTNKRVDQGWGANKGTAELSAEQQGNADAAKDANVEPALMGWGVDLAITSDAPAVDDWGISDDVKPSSPNAVGAANGNAETRRSKEKDEEEDNKLTLDEYLAKKAKAEATAVPKLETVRQANEGVDESLWKDAVPLAKGKEESNYFVGKTKSAPKARPKKEEKIHIEIDAHFERPSRGGRGRGDRGGERSRVFPFGRVRGGARGGAPENAQLDVNVADQSAFPSLA
ncbi:hypothetical protein JB92DRAFT_859857 [Gautieria morchelliformis]|nr:hypothetical protein JB92DRAFT_859857 [Gautieria morchelliformis]